MTVVNRKSIVPQIQIVAKGKILVGASIAAGYRSRKLIFVLLMALTTTGREKKTEKNAL
jgi:hypothetical protein